MQYPFAQEQGLAREGHRIEAKRNQVNWKPNSFL